LDVRIIGSPGDLNMFKYYLKPTVVSSEK